MGESERFEMRSEEMPDLSQPENSENLKELVEEALDIEVKTQPF